MQVSNSCWVSCLCVVWLQSGLARHGKVWQSCHCSEREFSSVLTVWRQISIHHEFIHVSFMTEKRHHSCPRKLVGWLKEVDLLPVILLFSQASAGRNLNSISCHISEILIHVCLSSTIGCFETRYWYPVQQYINLFLLIDSWDRYFVNCQKLHEFSCFVYFASVFKDVDNCKMSVKQKSWCSFTHVSWPLNWRTGMRVSYWQVSYEVTIEVKECPADRRQWKKTFQIYPVGLTEKLTVNLELNCECECEKSSAEKVPYSSVVIVSYEQFDISWCRTGPICR